MKSRFFLQLTIYTSLFINAPLFAQSLKKIDSIALPGEPGKRFDYLKIDDKDRYLFLAHLGANQVYIIDLKTNKLIKTISDTPGVEGIEYVQELNKVYTSNWGDKTIGVIDLKSMKVIKKIPAKVKPDGLVYAPPFQKLYISDERGKALIIVDVKKDVIIKTLEFKSETGMPQYDPVAQKIYLNLQDQNLFAVINPKTDTVEDTFSVGKCKGNHGMALDPVHHLAFLACEENNLLSVFNLNEHKIIAELPIPSGVDVIAFDPELKRIYAACYSGVISVIQEDDATHFRKLEDYLTEPKVHSLAVDLESHRVYVPFQEEKGKAVSRLVIFETINHTEKK